MKRISTLVIGILMNIPILTTPLLASGPGAKSAGMAEASVTYKDEWAVFNNVAGISGLKSLYALCSVDSRLSFKSFNTASAGAIFPLNKNYGTLCGDISRFGSSLYNESKLGIGFAHQIESISLGLKVSYLQLHIEEYGTRGALAMEFGGIVEITSGFSFGAHIFNFNQAKISKEVKEKIPVVMRMGLGYTALTRLLITAEVEKDERFPLNVKTGLEYGVIKNIYLRAGISSAPFSNTFGFGINHKSFKLDYALNSLQTLGFQHHLSLTYQFKS